MLIFKILGIVGIIVFFFGILLAIHGFDDFESNNFMIGGFLSCFGLFVGISCLCLGFMPEITKLNTKTVKYIQEENRKELKDIMDLSADISKDAIKKSVAAVKEGLEDCIFCKHCGKKIDMDSKFCRHCGKEQ